MQYLQDHFGELFVAVAMAVAGFFGKRLVNRVDELEHSKANKSDIAELLRQFSGHLEDDKQLRRELTASLEDVRKSVAEVSVSVARIEGRMGK